MKPINSFDRIMLWVARAYGLFALTFFSWRWVKFATEPPPIFDHLPPHTVVTYHGPTAFLAFKVLMYAVLVVGLLSLPGRVAKWAVILPAIALLGLEIRIGVLVGLLPFWNVVHFSGQEIFLIEKLLIDVFRAIAIDVIFIFIASRNGRPRQRHDHSLPGMPAIQGV